MPAAGVQVSLLPFRVQLPLLVTASPSLGPVGGLAGLVDSVWRAVLEQTWPVRKISSGTQAERAVSIRNRRRHRSDSRSRSEMA